MTQYLVEITPGRECVYHTLLALRDAIHAGEITSKSRIYHRTASRWIPITEHPEYRKYLTERRPPDWLEPIPFEPAQPIDPHQAPHGLRSLVAKLERAGATVRGWWARRRRSPDSAGSSAAPPSGSEASNPASPPHKGWTFLP